MPVSAQEPVRAGAAFADEGTGDSSGDERIRALREGATRVPGGLCAALALIALSGLLTVPRAAAAPAVAAERVSVCSSPSPGRARCYAQVIVHAPVGAAAARPFSVTNPTIDEVYNPLRFHKAYGLPTAAATDRTVAVVTAFDNPKIIADLNVANARWGLPAFKQCTTTVTTSCLLKVNQKGNVSPRPAFQDGWALETALDVQTLHATCQNCKILVVEANSDSFSDLAAAENMAVKLGANVASNSWGLEEAYYSAPASVVAAFNHPGIPIAVSSGDTGYEMGLGPSFPASLNTVVAVGGTTLTLDGSGNWSSEAAWSGAGSGCSTRYNARPPQNTTAIGNWPKTLCGTHRAVADVSAVADPATGVGIYDSTGSSLHGSFESGWFQVGGTSLASPLVAATYGLAGNPGVAYPATLLYANKTKLHDPILGVTGSCPSPYYMCRGMKGYDGPTGIGSPKGLAGF
jgi:subtilase family serine protease